MALKETGQVLGGLLCEMMRDLEKASCGNRAASQRVRTNSVKFAKVAKLFRKESILTERKEKKSSKSVKKKVLKQKAKK